METLPPQQRLQTQTQELPRTKPESKEIADMQEEVRTAGPLYNELDPANVCRVNLDQSKKQVWLG